MAIILYPFKYIYNNKATRFSINLYLLSAYYCTQTSCSGWQWQCELQQTPISKVTFAPHGAATMKNTVANKEISWAFAYGWPL